jgi:NAD(P)-dependent dehydrogenase (short-subunit alcohol dehydrogenase family)
MPSFSIYSTQSREVGRRRETTERFGAIDMLVNNAGYAELGFFEIFTEAAVQRQFEVNLFGTMNVARAEVRTCGSVAWASSSPFHWSAV